MNDHVQVCEVGPRDGLQIARGIMPTACKKEWIAALADAGLREIEVGSFVPPRLIPQMADTDAVVRFARAIPELTVAALAPNLRGVRNAYEAGAERIVVPVSISESHSRANLNRTPHEQVADVRSMSIFLRSQPAPVKLIAACSTAFGCSIEGRVPERSVVAIAEGLAEAGADEIVLADTVGYAHPGLVRTLVRAVRKAVGPRLTGLHLHDTMGMALANSLAGLEEGIRRFDAALAGLGGCPYAPGASGNVVTEDLVLLLESLGFRTGIDLPKLISARRYLTECLPEEPLNGHVAQAGLPKTFQVAP